MSAARRTRLLAAGALALAAATVPSVASAGPAPHRARHVLLISVDGMHESDLQWYVVRHPGSALARLVAGGVSFTDAQAPVPSDSFPGLLAQVSRSDAIGSAR